MSIFNRAFWRGFGSILQIMPPPEPEPEQTLLTVEERMAEVRRRMEYNRRAAWQSPRIHALIAEIEARRAAGKMKRPFRPTPPAP